MQGYQENNEGGELKQGGLTEQHRLKEYLHSFFMYNIVHVKDSDIQQE